MLTVSARKHNPKTQGLFVIIAPRSLPPIKIVNSPFNQQQQQRLFRSTIYIDSIAWKKERKNKINLKYIHIKKIG